MPPSQFSVHVYCGHNRHGPKRWGLLCMEVGLGPGHIVLDGEPAPLRQKGDRAPNFYCRQTAGCIKMALGMEVGLGPSHIVLDGDPASLPPKGARAPSPNFGQFLSLPNGWMHQDATWYEGRPHPRRLCVRWDPAPPPLTGHSPLFRPISVVAKRPDAAQPPILVQCLLWPNDWMD